MEDLTGKQLGPYQIIEPLGEGGMAAVYKAFQPSMERYVALKILPRHFASDPEFVGRFKQEARVIANLQHPHILPVHDFGEADGYTYLTMRFIEGGTLSDWLQEHTPIPLDKIRRVVSQVGGALDYAHAQGVIHRDIKPSNILVDQWDNCLLTDFGLAKMVATSSYLTQTGGILGTPAYMSPEQGLGKKIDNRSDIYSLGVVLYQMAVGHLPYQAETPMAVVIKHIHDPLPPPRQRDPNLAEAVELVILKTLAKNPEDRYRSAGDLVKALEQASTMPTVMADAAPAPVTAVAEPSEPPPPVIPEPEPDPTPATVIMESSSTAVAEPTPMPEPIPTPPPPPISAPLPSPPAAVPSPRKRRFKWRWALAGIGVIFICFIMLAIISNIQNQKNKDQASATVEVALNEAIDNVIRDTLDDPDIPEAVQARITLALDAVRNGDYEKAQEAFAQAVEMAPDNSEIYCERGYILRDMEMYNEAIADFKKCHELALQQEDPEKAATAFGEVTLTQARAVYDETNNLDDVLRVFDEALGTDQSPNWLQCERAEFMFGILGPDVAVIPDFEICAETMAGDDYWPWRAASILAWVRGQDALDHEEFETAVTYFQEWVNLLPDGPWPYCHLAFALDELEDYEGATNAFQQCFNLAEDEDTRQQATGGLKYVQAHVAVRNGDWVEAIAAYEEAINLLPDDPWLYCERAEVFLAMGNPAPALENARVCRDHSGEDVSIRDWAESLIRDISSE